MSAEVYPFPVKPKPPDSWDRYYCVKCSSELFKIYAHGSVHCLGCGSRMNNLSVQYTETK